MKIIQAMKKIKDLLQKQADLAQKVRNHCADLDFETPVYQNQEAEVSGWLQAHEDIGKEIVKLRTDIQRTNLFTVVTIELDGKQVAKTIAEWIIRRREQAKASLLLWANLTDRNLKEGQMAGSQPGSPTKDVRIRRYYDPKKRDHMMAVYQSEPSIIDSTLEVVNATQDLIERDE